MKKFFISIALFSVFSSVVLASDTRSGDPVTPSKSTVTVNKRVQTSFQKDFAGASHVQWERLQENIYQVRFYYNKELLNVFYTEDGQQVATGRFVNVSALPLLIQKNIARTYASYDLLQVIELTQNNATSYLLTLQNEQTRLTVQAGSDGSLTVFKKEKRNL
jgi:hypothetical protein